MIDNIVFQCIQFRQNETCRNRRIEERTVVTWHIRYVVLTSGEGQIKHIFVRSRYVTEESHRTVFPRLFLCLLSSGVVDVVPSREVVVRTIFIILLSVTLDNFVTQYSVQSPVLVDAPVIVDGQQRVVCSVRPAVVFNLSATATGVTTVSVAVYIVSGVSIHADHVFCVQLVVGCTKISLIACVYISEETVGIFCEFVVFHCPISVVKATTERILCVRVTVYVTWNTSKIIAGRSCVNRSQQTVTGSHCLVDGSSDVVGCKSGTPVTSQFGVGTNLYIISIHTGA